MEPHEQHPAGTPSDSAVPPPSPTLPAGWYPDPISPGVLRYWDGATWADRTRTRAASSDLPAPAAAGTKPPSVYATPFLAPPRPKGAAPAAIPAKAAGLMSGTGPAGAAAPPPVCISITDAPAGASGALAAFLDPPTVAPPPGREGAVSRVRRFARATRLDPRRRRGLVLRTGGASILLASMTVLGYSVYESFISNELAERSQNHLAEHYEELAAVPSTSAPPAPEPPAEVPAAPLPDGEIVGKLVMPSIAAEHIVLAGSNPATLKQAPGVWEHGAIPGSPGNATISGHRTTYGAPFRHLDDLSEGDRIIFQRPGKPDAVYEVRGTMSVAPTQVSVTHPTPGVRLTLTTCEPVGSASQRLVVQAELVEGEHVERALPAADWHFQV